jgi:surfactin synthase thioesterase subunit
MNELVEGAMQAVWSDCQRPYAFFGHSLGALVAYETARLIQRRGGAPPTLLIVSGCAAPHLFQSSQRLHELPSGELWQELARLGGIAPELLQHAELLELLEPAIRADLAVCRAYRCGSETQRLECDVHAFVARSDPRVDEPATRAWQQRVSGAFSLDSLPGGHFSLFDRQLNMPARILNIIRARAAFVAT